MITGLRRPLLVVPDSKSTLLDRPTLATMTALCPHAEGVETAGVHHHVMLDRPEVFSERLDAFLDRSVSASA